MTMSDHIRWERGRWDNQLGYVGTHEPFAFQIFKSEKGDYALSAQFPGVDGVLGRSADPEALKPVAEEALIMIVSRLGASFPASIPDHNPEEG